LCCICKTIFVKHYYDILDALHCTIDINELPGHLRKTLFVLVHFEIPFSIAGFKGRFANRPYDTIVYACSIPGFKGRFTNRPYESINGDNFKKPLTSYGLYYTIYIGRYYKKTLTFFGDFSIFTIIGQLRELQFQA